MVVLNIFQSITFSFHGRCNLLSATEVLQQKSSSRNVHAILVQLIANAIGKQKYENLSSPFEIKNIDSIAYFAIIWCVSFLYPT